MFNHSDQPSFGLSGWCFARRGRATASGKFRNAALHILEYHAIVSAKISHFPELDCNRIYATKTEKVINCHGNPRDKVRSKTVKSVVYCVGLPDGNSSGHQKSRRDTASSVAFYERGYADFDGVCFNVSAGGHL